MCYTVGERVLARTPESIDEVTWVTGRVLGTRSHAGVVQYKVSLDGYDSENDEWMEEDDERVRPYAVAADEKEAARREADEKVAARLQSEARRHDGRMELEAATTKVG